MALPSLYATVASHDGYCAGCDVERPLVVMEHGPRGLRAWLAGVGPEDRGLSYTCCVCGRVEHVPLTEAEDDDYAATLRSWPDWSPVDGPVAVPAVAVGDVFGLAAVRVRSEPVVVLPAPRPSVVRVITLPVQRVTATDDRLLALT